MTLTATAAFMGLSFAQSADIAANEKTEAPVTTTIEVPNKKGLSRIFIVGDSTASPFNDPYYLPRYGFGTKLQDYLNANKASVVNLAVSGRSSKSFIEDAGSAPNYELLKENIRKGDYLLIAFGHNDEKLEAERYTNPNGDKDTEGSFKHSLYENYVKLAQSVNATPVLVTPIVRLNLSNVYEGADVHLTKGNEEYAGGDYSQAIRDLGKELGITVVDQTANTKALYEKLGDEARKLHAQNSKNEKSLDKTHLNVYGASKIAYILVKDLAAKDKKFKKLVEKNIVEPTEELRVPNPLYVEPGYGAPTEKSKIFTATEPWWASVFGECSGQGKISSLEYYEIKETEKGVYMRSGTTDVSKPAGKISSSADGIAFYFQQLASSADFTLSATANVINIKSNNQVSFGLMVRDNVLIDTNDSAVSSNYVACGPLFITKAIDENAGRYASFARDGGSLVPFFAKVSEAPKAGDKIALFMEKKGDEITVKYGNEESFTYKINLKEYDAENIYAGLYTSRNAVVEYSDIKFDIK